MPAKRRHAIACLAAAAPTKALRLGGLRRPRPPPSIPRAGAETVAEHIARRPFFCLLRDSASLAQLLTQIVFRIGPTGRQRQNVATW